MRTSVDDEQTIQQALADLERLRGSAKHISPKTKAQFEKFLMAEHGK